MTNDVQLIYRRLCRSAYKLVADRPTGIEIACKYCESPGTIRHGEASGFVEHMSDCPLVLCENVFAAHDKAEQEMMRSAMREIR